MKQIIWSYWHINNNLLHKTYGYNKSADFCLVESNGKILKLYKKPIKTKRKTTK